MHDALQNRIPAVTKTILHIITGLNNGGAEAVLYRLVSADKNNMHHVVSLMDAGLYGERFAAAGCTVHCLNMPRGRATLQGIVLLYSLVRRVKPDVVQTWMYHADLLGGVIARIAGVRAVVWGIRNSNLDASKATRSTRLVARMCASISGIVPVRIVSCSEVAATIHAAFGYSRNKMVVIANGYDVGQLAPDAQARKRLRSELGVEEGEVLFGMVARWDPLKDHANLIAALALFDQTMSHPWRCLLVGPNMDYDNAKLRELLQQYGMEHRVMLIGPRRDIPDVMNALDLHVLSSYDEAFPNVVAEAMACGVPPVVTNVGDAGLIVGTAGWVVPRCDPYVLAEAIGEAVKEMTNEDGWKRRQDECRTRVMKNFNLGAMVSGYCAVWQLAFDAATRGSKPR